MKPRKARVFIRGMVINAKMDRAIAAGIIASVLKQHPRVTFLLFQEISNVKQLQNHLPKGWELRPARQRRGENGRTGTQFIAFKTSVWKYEDHENLDIAGANGRHGRRMLAVCLTHKRSKKLVWLLDAHPDPLGQGVVKASPGARKAQRFQINQFAKFVKKQATEASLKAQEVYFVLGGDLNQPFTLKLPKQYEQFGVNHILGTAGLRSSAGEVKNPGQQRLLEVFVSENVRYNRRVGYVPAGFPDTVLDHEVVFAELELL